MAKPRTFPTLFEECLQFSIYFLKKYGYLKTEQKKGTCNWIRKGEKVGSLSFEINLEAEPSFVVLDYTFKGKPRKCKINLVSAPSNVGNGKLWYFVCPATGKRCKILYCVDGYFLHREAFKGCLYWIQTKSKQGRLTVRKNKPFWEGNEKDQLQAKYFKAFYNGKPTKRYLRLVKKIMVAESLPDPNFDKFISKFIRIK